MLIDRCTRPLLALFALLLAVESTSALKVLGLFPHPAISHFHFFEPVLRGLAEAGHEVSVLGLFPLKDAPANYTDIPMEGEVLTGGIDLQSEWFVTRRQLGHYYEMGISSGWAQVACDSAYNSTGLQRILRDKPHFDVILMEQFNTDCMMGVAWHLQVPVVAMSTCVLKPWHHDRMGNPHIPSYIPSLFQPSSEQMTFSQRFYNFIDVHVMRIIYRNVHDVISDAKLKQVFGDAVPPVAELAKTTSLMFVNQHYSMVGARPLSPSVIELGGIHIKKPAPLDPAIQKYLDNAVEGVIFVSWGSMVRATSLPDDKRQSLVEAFGSIKERVLWKWENDTIPNQPANVRIGKWLQQRDILCHPNVKAFVSHAGLLGSSEAVHCGVPVVSTPMFGDQFHNAAAFVNRKMGVIVHYEDISKESMTEAIRTVLRPEYMANAKQVSHTFNNRLQTPLATAIWWVEHVAQTGGSPLSRSYSVFMSGWTYHSLDVIAVLVAIVAAVIASWWWMMCACCCSGDKTTSRKEKRQ